MIHGINVVRVHIKTKRAQVFLFRFGHLHDRLADAHKGVDHTSCLFVKTFYRSTESVLQKIDERRSGRGKQAGGNMPETNTDKVRAAARSDEPVVTKRVRHKCSAFSIRPVGRLAHAGRTDGKGSRIKRALVGGIAVLDVDV